MYSVLLRLRNLGAARRSSASRFVTSYPTIANIAAGDAKRAIGNGFGENGRANAVATIEPDAMGDARRRDKRLERVGGGFESGELVVCCWVIS